MLKDLDFPRRQQHCVTAKNCLLMVWYGININKYYLILVSKPFYTVTSSNGGNLIYRLRGPRQFSRTFWSKDKEKDKDLRSGPDFASGGPGTNIDDGSSLIIYWSSVSHKRSTNWANQYDIDSWWGPTGGWPGVMAP